MLYLLHGEDEFRRAEWLSELKQTVSLDGGEASLNTVHLNGQRLTFEEIVSHCGAVPFLADKRLVIVEGLAARGDARQAKSERSKGAAQDTPEKRMAEYLATVPASTDVVLSESKTLAPSNQFLQAVKAAGGRVIEFKPPKPESRELREWLLSRARARGAQLSEDAADHLLSYLGNNLRLLDQELAKLATYAEDRTIESDDVQRLVAYAREANIFDAMDALGRRDQRLALRKIHDLLAEGQSAQYLLAMIMRHVRLLIEAREALDHGVPPQGMAQVLAMHPFAAQKMGEQARNFSLPALLGLHDQLVELDFAGKTGRLEAETAVDLLVASVGRRA